MYGLYGQSEGGSDGSKEFVVTTERGVWVQTSVSARQTAREP